MSLTDDAPSDEHLNKLAAQIFHHTARNGMVGLQREVPRDTSTGTAG